MQVQLLDRRRTVSRAAIGRLALEKLSGYPIRYSFVHLMTESMAEFVGDRDGEKLSCRRVKETFKVSCSSGIRLE